MTFTTVVLGEVPRAAGLRSPRWPREIDHFLVPALVVIAIFLSWFAAGLVSTVFGGLGMLWFWASCVIVFVLSLSRSSVYRPGAARIAASESALRFAGRKTLVIGRLLLAVLAALLGVVGVMLMIELVVAFGWDEAMRSLPGSSGLAIAIGLVGVYLTVRFALALSRSRGLTLDPDGLTAQWGGAPQRLAWGDLARATIELNDGKSPLLVLLGGDGSRALELRATEMGSDPMIVAALIHFFRDHPEERALLTDPWQAWEGFRESLTGGLAT